MFFDKLSETEKVKWRDLAHKSDDEILSYFRTIKGQNERHAANSLRFLRRQYGGPSPAPYAPPEPRPAPTPAPTFTPEPPVEPVHAPKPVPAPQQPAPLPPVLGVPGPSNEGLAPLAAMLAPHLAPMIAGNVVNAVTSQIERAVADMHATLAAQQVTKIVLHAPPAEPKPLDGVHHESAAKIIGLAAQRLNVMMVGPAGCGKTVLASSVAQAQEKSLTVISCSAGMSEAQLLGRLLPLGDGGAFRYVESPFIKAYAAGGVILLDEIDAADANLLLVINAALANGQIEIEARAANGLPTCVKRHPETVILAAANTWGSGADTQYMGRGALDASTLDRFYRVAVDYDAGLEAQIGTPQVVTWVHRTRDRARTAKLRRVVSTRMIVRMCAGMQAGMALTDVISDELASWSADERAKVL